MIKTFFRQTEKISDSETLNEFECERKFFYWRTGEAHSIFCIIISKNYQ